jgi:hypothetical protein
MNAKHLRSIPVVLAPLLIPGALSAQDTTATKLAPVVVEVGRGTNKSLLELPFAVTAQTPDSARPGQRHLSIDDAFSTADALLHVLLALAEGQSEAGRSDEQGMWGGTADILEQIIAHVEALHRQAVECSNQCYATAGGAR